VSTYSYTIKSGQSTILVGYLVSGGAVDIIGLLLAFTPPADIPIPSSIKGLPVKEVGGFGYSGVAGVTVPSSVLSIDSNAFVACSLMTNLSLSDGLATIGIDAFWFTSIRSLIIPDTVIQVGASAFGSCGYLTNVTLGMSLTNFNPDVFCSSPLQTINVSPANPAYAAVDGILFTSNRATLIEYPAGRGGSYTVPDGVTNIGPGAFQYSDLTSVTFPLDLVEIQTNAFYSCNLGSVTLPDSLTTLGDFAFDGCSNLTSVTLGSGLTIIGDSAFGNSDLFFIAIPPGVTSIGTGAFADCWNLRSIDVALGNQFYSSSNGVLFDRSGAALIQYPSGNSAASYALPYGVTSIESGAFSNCSNLVNVTIPDTVTTIGSNAFGGCANLVNVAIGRGLTAIGTSAFADCPNLNNVYCMGNEPAGDSSIFESGDGDLFDPVTVYYLPGSIGWSSTLGGLSPAQGDVINYTATPTNGAAPVTVTFTAQAVDSSGVVVDAWFWSFGDGSTSAAQNPTHDYLTNGIFYVVLFATNTLNQAVMGVGFDTITIGALSPPPPPPPEIVSVARSGSELLITVSNGSDNTAYITVASTNLTQPINEWTPLATNTVKSSGTFSITVNNAINFSTAQRYFALKTANDL
jgi:PKD repeat protein